MPSKTSSTYTISVQDRDLKILRGLFEARIMTAEHIAAIYFDGRYEAARKRLQKLKSAGYVGERPRRAYDPAVNFLTRKAFVLLCQSGTIADLPRITWPSLERRVRVSESTLRHELEVQDVRAAFHLAAAKTENLKIGDFTTWPLLCQFNAFNSAGQAVTVKPDGFIRLQEKNADGDALEHLFFLELDRSTEPQQTLGTRAECYRDFYQRGGLAARFGRPRSEYRDFPFRVLMIFRTPERRNNTAERLLCSYPPILSQVWLTTFTEVTADALGAIWVRPGDYRSCTAGSAYEVAAQDGKAYKSRRERERSVEQRITKSWLLTRTAEPKQGPSQ